jgi:hypothetical protein
MTGATAPPPPERSPRKVRINVMRYNPQERGSVPRMQTYELEEADGMTLFIALNEIRETQTHRCIRFRLPRRDMRQLRDGDQRRPASPPYADAES